MQDIAIVSWHLFVIVCLQKPFWVSYWAVCCLNLHC